VAEQTDEIERTGDENGVLGRGFGEGVFKRALGVGDYGKVGGMMAGDFGELRRGDGARSVWRGENDFGGMGEEKAGNFVDGFVAKSGVNHPDLACREILLQEMCEFTRRAGIMRAIEINVGRGLKFFKAPGPDGLGDTLGDGFVGDWKAAFLKRRAAATALRALWNWNRPSKPGTMSKRFPESSSMTRAWTLPSWMDSRSTR
jgi:hypothetical protein